MLERRLFRALDWQLVGALALLTAIGLAMIYSATYDPTSGRVGSEFGRQAVAVVIGFAACALCVAIDYRTLADQWRIAFGALSVLLAYTLLFGDEVGGGRRWIDLGPANLQPSEFARATVALALAAIYTRSPGWPRPARDWFLGGALVAVPFLLIAQEPDLGTAATLLPVYLVVMVFAGLRLRALAAGAIVALLAAPVVWAYGLEDYQRSRIVSFLTPESDPLEAGYQQIQARITVGAGGLTGRGYLQGTQNRYDFLPAAHNDFIFSVLAEEQGFLGVVFTLCLYLFVILRSLRAAQVARDRTGTYLVVGIMAGFSFQVLYSVAMSAGFAPVKGLTLPLLSYGGSSFIATLMGFGLVLNVGMRRFTN
ncbi:MAG: rod shape-determining protein RodA [Acidobacteria bacterium]|nr:rod shape-determining protein RodA [Acidobacteriota bacterium]